MSGTASMARERQRPVAMTEAPFTIDTPTGPIAGFTSTETGSELLLFGLAPSTANGPFTVAQHVADAIAVLDSLGRRRTTLPDWRRRESEDSLDDTENPVHDAVVAQPYSGVRRDEHGVELESREVRAAAHGAGVRQIALAWQLQGSPQALPIPGTTSLAHLRENLAAWSIVLSEREMRAIDAIATPGDLA
jgi:hypothetical protein